MLILWAIYLGLATNPISEFIVPIHPLEMPAASVSRS
jgi:hypothetical protein